MIWVYPGLLYLVSTVRADFRAIVLCELFESIGWSPLWDKRFCCGVAETYKTTLKSRINKLCEFFKDMSVEDIKVDDVQDFLNSISDKSKGTIDFYRKHLADFMAYMCEDGLIVKNPARSRRLMIPGNTGDGIVGYDRDATRRLFAIIPILQDEAMRLILALMLFAGLRREEAFGLRWEDIDYQNHLLHIQRAVVLPSDAPVMKETKTNKKRDVPIPDVLHEILTRSKRHSGFVVLDSNGRQFTKSRYKKLWAKTKAVTGFADLDARKLRHTYATYSAISGVEMKTLATCMGHETLDMTFKVYTQLDHMRLGEIRNNMSDFINN